MKRTAALLLVLALCAGVFAGCKKTPSPENQTTSPEQTTVPEDLPSADATTLPEETTAEETTQAGDPAYEPVNRYLDAPLDEAGWLREGNARYAEACRVFFTYMCSSAWLQVDENAPAIYDVYYPVLNFSSLKEAEADFLTVFSEYTFGTALESILMERDGKLYAAIADRGTDAAYKGFDMEKIDKVGDGYIEFTVRTHYTDGDDLAKFALRYERGAYRVDKFEMPY